MSTQLSTLIEGQRAQFMAVSVDPNIRFEREAGFALQILGANEFLAKVGMSNPDSLKAAITNIAAIGISLNPASKLAYLVPRDGRVCLDLSFIGLLAIATQSGSILWGQAEVVRAKDQFALRGYDQAPLHTYSPFDPDRGEVVGAYVVVKTPSGDYLTTAMPISEINDIRDRSSAWKAWLDKKKKCPWVTDPGEMAKKTVIKRASKLWPKSERLDTAIHHLNTDGNEGLAELAKPERDITPLSDDQKTAINDYLTEMSRTWAQLAPVCKQLFKREVPTMEDLTQEEAVRVLAFLAKRKEGVQ